MGSSATVRNLTPDILSWEVTVDETIGAFHYHVAAYDGNGVADLDRLAFYVIDEQDGTVRDLQYFEDHRDTNRTTAQWQGILIAKGAPYTTPHRVELHVIDVNQGRAVARAPYDTLDRLVDTAGTTQHAIGDAVNASRPAKGPDQGFLGVPFGTFTERVEPLAPLGAAGLATLGLAGLALLGAAGALWAAHRPVRDTPRGPEQAVVVAHRAGGRPGGLRPRP